MNTQSISENQFNSFKEVQKSGVTNMMNTKRVAREMSKRGEMTFPEEVKQIIGDFDELSAKFSS